MQSAEPITVTPKMRTWVAAYIRSHRKPGIISIDVKKSHFNEDFFTQFNVSPRMVIHALIREGFLEGADRPGVGKQKASFAIWLVEDKGSRKGPRTIVYRQQPHTQPRSEIKSERKETMPASATSSSVSFEPKYAFEKIPHPKTGEVNVLGTIQYLMECIWKQMPADAHKDGGYSLSDFSLTALMTNAGMPNAQRPELSRILQEMGLVRTYSKRAKRRTWGVLDKSAVRFFVTEELYLQARDALLERGARNNEMYSLRRQLESAGSSAVSEVTKDAVTHPVSTDETLVTTFEDEAIEALAQAERLADELKAAKARIDALEKELAARPTSAEAARQALADRLDALKKQSN